MARRGPASRSTATAPRSIAPRGRAARLARTIGGRLLSIAAVLLGAVTIAFIAVKLIPGDPVQILSGGENVVDEEQRAVIARQFGLDQPVWVQYLRYVQLAFTGDLGDSYSFRRPVVEVIADSAGHTAQLAFGAIVLAILLAIVAAIATAGRPGPLRTAVAGVELVLLSTPVYWLGIILLAIFSFQLGWFPVVGNHGPSGLVLPVLAVALPIAALLSQVLRDGLEQALEQPFAITVRTRGVSELALRIGHGFRHSLLAAATLTGTVLGGVLGGSVLTETVFGRPGIGVVLLGAISTRDMPLVLGLVLLSALVFVVVNLFVDAVYLLIDPRLRKATAS